MRRKIQLIVILYCTILSNECLFAETGPQKISGISLTTPTITSIKDLNNNAVSVVCPGQTVHLVGVAFSPIPTIVMGGIQLAIIGTPTTSDLEVKLPPTLAGSIQISNANGSTTYSSFATNSSVVSTSSLLATGISPICAGTNGTVSIPNTLASANYQAYIGTYPVSTSYTGTGNASPLVISIPYNYMPAGKDTIRIVETKSSCLFELDSKPVIVVVPRPDTTTVNFYKTLDTLCYNEGLTVKLPNAEAGVVYRFYKWNSGGTLNTLDSSSVPSLGTGIQITIPFSKFTPGSVDTIHYLAVRPGCAAVINHKKILIYVSALSPLNPITHSGTSLCAGVVLNAPYFPNVQYSWYYNDDKIVNALSYRDTAYSEGSYTVLSQDLLNCQAISPAINLDYGSLKPQVIGGNPSTLSTELSSSSSPGSSYQWYANTSTGFKKIQGANANSYTAYFDAEYMVGITTGNCFILSDIYPLSGKIGGSLLRSSSFAEDSSIVVPYVDFNRDATVYPNPVTKGGTFSVNYIIGSEKTNVSFTLYNSQGLEILSKKIESNGYITVDFNVPEIPSGLYKLIISDGVRVAYKSVNIY